MDSVEEDVSARLLLKNVLHTEIQRSPVTGASQAQPLSYVRRSSRVRNTPRIESPQHTLRNKLKQKLHECATQSPLPPSKRARSQGRTIKTPVVISPALFDEEITPRGLLRGIIQTETEASLLLSGQPGMPEGDQEHVEESAHNSEGGSGLELPDLATESLNCMIKGMSRRRPPPSFNVSAFERQLDPQSGEVDNPSEDVTQEHAYVTKDDFTIGLKSLLSLTLKTPSVTINAQRAGLQRKAAGRKQPSVDTFDEAVQKRLQQHNNQDSTVLLGGKTLGDSEWHKFTLGMSNISVPELTTDIVITNTELYAQPPVYISACEMKEDKSMDAKMKMQENERDYEADKKRENLQIDQQDDVSVALQDNQNMYPSSIIEMEPEPLKQLGDQESDSQLQEVNKMEMVPSSQEQAPVSFTPEEILFAPNQPMVMSESQIIEEAAQESEVQEVIEWQEEASLPKEQLSSQQSNQITRRAYHSEGGSVIPRILARGRETMSLGAELDPTKKELQSFAVGDGPETLASTEEAPHSSLASPSKVYTLKHSYMTHGNSLAQAESDEEGFIEKHISGSENGNSVAPSANLSPILSSTDKVLEEEVEEEDNDDNEYALSEDISVKTPAFIRQRKNLATPGALATPTALKASNASHVPKHRPKSRQKQRQQFVHDNVLPKSYVMSIFKHFAKSKVANDVYPVINEILRKYFSRLAEDLEAYSAHAKRKTIEVEDVELLMKRQGFVSDSSPVTVLIEKFLPLEHRKLLIPIATSGNKVIPEQRR